MVNEFPKKKIYDALRRQVSGRLIRAMDIAEADIGTLSLGELINTLFLMHGDCGSTGNFNVCCRETGNHRASAAGAVKCDGGCHLSSPRLM